MTQLTATNDLKADLKSDLATEILGFSFFDAPENVVEGAAEGDGQYDSPNCARVLGLHEQHSADIVDNLLDEALADDALLGDAFIGALLENDWPLVMERMEKIATKVAELFTLAYMERSQGVNTQWDDRFVASYFETNSMDVLEAARDLHRDVVITTHGVVHMSYGDLLAAWLVHTYANPVSHHGESNTGWLAKHLGNTCRGVLSKCVLNAHELAVLTTGA
jgi:hypothetical protein